MLPIVLHHGLLGSGDLSIGPVKLSYFGNIDRAIAQQGHPIIVSRVHPTGSIQLRARQLKVNILKGLKQHSLPRHSRVLIIAHSMGGLDARFMISKLGMADRVAGLLSITTPHRAAPTPTGASQPSARSSAAVGCSTGWAWMSARSATSRLRAAGSSIAT
jgi:triacylglycerol lipase